MLRDSISQEGRSTLSEKKFLFSVSIGDCEVQTFCTGGPGGQHKNAKQNGVRVIHHPSKARAEHRDGRDQHLNKRAAFVKMTETSEFKTWHRLETARLLGKPSPESIVSAIMEDFPQFRVEVKNAEGRWVDESSSLEGPEPFRNFMRDVRRMGLIPQPHIYPTPEGEICMEWSFPGWEVSATTSTCPQKLLVHGTHLESNDYEEFEVDFSLPDAAIEFVARYIKSPWYQ